MLGLARDKAGPAPLTLSLSLWERERHCARTALFGPPYFSCILSRMQQPKIARPAGRACWEKDRMRGARLGDRS